MTDSVRIVGGISAVRNNLHQIVYDAALAALKDGPPAVGLDPHKAMAASIALRAHQVARHEDETGKSSILYYIATPFSAYPAGIEQAWVDACKLTARLIESGLRVYSPIAMTYALALHGNLDQMDLNLWLPFDEAMMTRCDSLIVARLPSWETSKGIAHEIQFFADAGKPIFDLHPETLVMTRRG